MDRTAPAAHSDAWRLADVIARLRRTLRASIRSDYPWEKLPMAQVEILQRLEDEPGLRVNDIADRHRLAKNTVSQLVQQLVSAGLADRRAVLAALPALGRLVDELSAGAAPAP